MVTLMSYLLLGIVVLFAVPAVVFVCEVLAAACLRTYEADRDSRDAFPGRAAVLVPAHNEGMGLLSTMADISAQLRPGDRLVVVADNCSDDTAQIAAAAGGEVAIRNDPERIGKGYALDWGLRHLSTDPPDVVVVIDADCRVASRTIDRLVATCITTGRPVQALYLMTAPDRSILNYQAAEFAWRVKNWMRPLGLSKLGLPCQLMGTGMAFPFSSIRSADLATGHIVEDLKLGLDLALAGRPPRFCPSALVTSQFPASAQGAVDQRRRWEHGSIMILRATPRYIFSALKTHNLSLLILALDFTVPPLALFGLLLTAIFLIAACAAFLGLSSAALFVAAAALVAFLLAVFVSWRSCGRTVLHLRSMRTIIPYLVAKLPIYWQAVSGRSISKWTRTDRKAFDETTRVPLRGCE